MFEDVKFKGTFRTYQQKVLDGADEYLSDGKINVVAAPGSGKTILGLELIRRLGKPCIILSPTVTIRDQWGERFTGSFSGADSSFLSYDLKNIKPITSVTYQALYSAVARVKCSDDGEEVDNSSLDIFKAVKESGIGTICLDEAHHLQNEWQRALETFVENSGGLTIISLTATPPYDASAGEWQRYIKVCGEIDEEIFVPELVKQGTLCPHQDYIYFNYPSDNEIDGFIGYRRRADEALKEVAAHPLLKCACERLTRRFAEEKGFLYTDYNEISALLSLFEFAGLEPEKSLKKDFDVKRRKKFDAAQAQLALNYLVTQENLLDETERSSLKEIFKRYDLTERGKISLELNEKLKRTLVSSTGKLESISAIAKCESDSMGKKLRLLALTDYIKKDGLSCIGTDKKFDSISVISVFETLRRTSPLPVAALSGSLVILPVACANSLEELGAKFIVRKLGAEDYAEFLFKGSNRDKVSFVGKLFERGEVNILVGTKSLLGEGWDSPCINSLILASFVGSFMLSNQMRGRAIRTDKSNPEKTANVWHLVTVEPEYVFVEGALKKTFAKINGDDSVLRSYDFEILSRRFDCFVAPAYDKDSIENGIERISVIKPPYNKSGVKKINERTCKLAVQREKLKSKWNCAIENSEQLNSVSEVPRDRKIPTFTFYNVGLFVFLISIISGCSVGVSFSAINRNSALVVVLLIIICLALVIFCNYLLGRILRHCNPKRSVKTLANCVLQTLKELNLISSDCRINVSADEFGLGIDIQLVNSSLRDRKIYHKALQDLFSPIENPRYIIIPRAKIGRYNYYCALACPDILGSKQEYASAFAQKLKRSLGRLEVVYTRTDRGRAFIYKCRTMSYVTYNAKQVRNIIGN